CIGRAPASSSAVESAIAALYQCCAWRSPVRWWTAEMVQYGIARPILADLEDSAGIVSPTASGHTVKRSVARFDQFAINNGTFGENDAETPQELIAASVEVYFVDCPGINSSATGTDAVKSMIAGSHHSIERKTGVPGGVGEAVQHREIAAIFFQLEKSARTVNPRTVGCPV